MLLANKETGLAVGLNATKNEACACLNRTQGTISPYRQAINHLKIW